MITAIIVINIIINTFLGRCRLGGTQARFTQGHGCSPHIILTLDMSSPRAGDSCLLLMYPRCLLPAQGRWLTDTHWMKLAHCPLAPRPGFTFCPLSLANIWTHWGVFCRSVGKLVHFHSVLPRASLIPSSAHILSFQNPLLEMSIMDHSFHKNQLKVNQTLKCKTGNHKTLRRKHRGKAPWHGSRQWFF